ncbi:hypothetical protein XELAEV_18043325mg [Xenopus laevis]|uniref:Uncharacterized protein n=1 Tax=Xenopus laevis TaxID=8355 RepID=A0A974BWW7_XENLA|nr:hypothetical protein XELAEV_18043325mg [Xenopus laevis]
MQKCVVPGGTSHFHLGAAIHSYLITTSSCTVYNQWPNCGPTNTYLHGATSGKCHGVMLGVLVPLCGTLLGESHL